MANSSRTSDLSTVLQPRAAARRLRSPPSPESCFIDSNISWASHEYWRGNKPRPFSLPIGIFLLHNFISELPRELMEAARVDGASHARIFRQIVLPLIGPALASFELDIELAERFEYALLFRGEQIVAQVPTYRGEMRSFF